MLGVIAFYKENAKILKMAFTEMGFKVRGGARGGGGGARPGQGGQLAYNSAEQCPREAPLRSGSCWMAWDSVLNAF